MFFGTTTFAEDSFSAQGSKSVTVALTGISTATAIGNATVSTDVVVSLTGFGLTTTQGSVVASGSATFLVTVESLFDFS